MPWRVDSPAEVAAVVLARRRSSGTEGRGLVVGNPLPAAEQLDPELHDRVLADGLEAARRERVSGKDVTPFLLDHFHRETAGASLEANVRAGGAQRPAGGRIAAAAAARVSRIVVLGDVMVDVVARLDGPLAPERRPGADRLPRRRIGRQHGGVAGYGRALAPCWSGGWATTSAAAPPPPTSRRRVEARLAVDGERPTGTCIVLVGPDGERTMVPDPGANDGLAQATCRTSSSARAGTSTWRATRCFARARGRLPRRRSRGLAIVA